MTSGTTNEGVHYDGVMRSIRGNHVALVEAGRAGADVIVGDSLLEIGNMSKQLSKKAVLAKGALLAVLRPKLAADAMPDLNSILKGVKKSNWNDKKAGIVSALKPVLASDEELEENVNETLNALDEEEPEMEKEMGKDAGPVEEILSLLRGKVSDDDLKEVEELLKGKLAGDEDEEEKPAYDSDDLLDKIKELLEVKAVTQDEPPAFEGEPKTGVEKPAMDAAIKKAVKLAEDSTVKRLRAVHEAEKAVKPVVGELAIAQDSAEGVYKASLEILGVSIDGVHPSAYKSVFEAHSKAKSQVSVAQDAAPSEGFETRFPDANRIRSI